MGYNPYRKFVRHKGDILFVVLGVGTGLALVVWAAWPR